jgi:hypothetical protein
MKQRKINRRVMHSNPKQRLELATSGVPDSPWIADATPFFDRCVNELMSLHFAGRMGIMDLFNWSVSDVFTKTFNYITYNRPEHAEGTATPGHLADPCADPHGFEYGTSQITLEGFGRYGRMGPVREIIKAERYCETDPRYRLDGTPVTSEFEWDMAFMMDVLKQDLFRDIVVGNSATAGKFDGLLQWINTDYDTELLNSTVVDWNGNGMNGGAGTTVNGRPIADDTNLINVLLAIFRRFRQRIKWSPMLATEELNGRNMVLVLPTHLAECLLDAFTCWSVCEGQEFNPVNLMTYEARNFRDTLNGGRYGGGFIRLDGQVIDLYPYDWETMHGSTSGDMYFLTLSVGNQQLWEGEHLNAAEAARRMGDLGHKQYFSTDGGRIIGTTDVDNLCRQTKIWIRPRLVNRAPWLQARIMDVRCERILDPISPDPESSFFPNTSFEGEMRTVA